VAALISAAFLFFIGLISNLFTSIFVSRTLFEMALAIRNQSTSLSI
jgi:preprotein translocase subunit SecD